MNPIQDYRQTLAEVQEQARKREEVMQSEAYQSLQQQIEALQESQAQLLSHIPDSREENEMDKEELIKYMMDNNLTQAEEFKAKTRAKRSVDTMAVLRAMEGDIDNLMLVSSIKQKDLETFIKDNPSYKRDLRSCIIDEGYTITDIVIS
jgi:hypothetical protein